MTTVTSPLTRFSMPPGSDATAPAERRGVARDGVRLLVASPGGVDHVHFRDLSDHLAPGDLLVINTSATLPAAVEATRADGGRSVVHVSTVLDDGSWVVEARRTDNTGPAADVAAGEALLLPGHLRLRVQESFPRRGVVGARLWRTRPSREVGLTSYLSEHGRPIRYPYLSGAWPLEDLQNVYAEQPGSAEMPSAGRPFSEQLLVRLMARGVVVAPVVLHAGVSSPEKHEPPMPERYDVPVATAELINLTRASGRRVVAVGTTVVRALESVADLGGQVSAAGGWTDLVLGPSRAARVVTGLVTGLHEPEASHLLLLEAVAGPGLVRAAYGEAVAERYLWHEFGDSMLLLPDIGRLHRAA